MGTSQLVRDMGREFSGDALRENIPQIVMLGAGFDTRAYRYFEEIGDTTIFEVDIESTLRKKLVHLSHNEITAPSSLAYVSVDFTTDSLPEKMLEAGYDPEKRTLFLWEGVVPYLTGEAVERTLRFVQNSSPSGSTLFFDYLTEARDSLVDAEPFLFWSTPQEMVTMLDSFSIEVNEMLHASDIENCFLTTDGECDEESLAGFTFCRGVIR